MLLQISADEMACRIIEAVYGQKRPRGKSPQQALEAMTDEETRYAVTQATHAAIGYMLEQIHISQGGCAIEMTEEQMGRVQ